LIEIAQIEMLARVQQRLYDLGHEGVAVLKQLLDKIGVIDGLLLLLTLIGRSSAAVVRFADFDEYLLKQIDGYFAEILGDRLLFALLLTDRLEELGYSLLEQVTRRLAYLLRGAVLQAESERDLLYGR
jgi:hypothetical protein